MSKIFPNAYAVFFVVQIEILMVVYVILRFKTKLKVLTALCFSVLVVMLLILLLLCSDTCFNIYAFVQYTNLQKYVAGTLVVAISFMLILIVQFLVSYLKEIGSATKAAGPERTHILRMIEVGKITSEEESDLLEALLAKRFSLQRWCPSYLYSSCQRVFSVKSRFSTFS